MPMPLEPVDAAAPAAPPGVPMTAVEKILARASQSDVGGPRATLSSPSVDRAVLLDMQFSSNGGLVARAAHASCTRSGSR